MELIVFFGKNLQQSVQKKNDFMQPANNLSKEYPKCICAKNPNIYFDTMV